MWKLAAILHLLIATVIMGTLMIVVVAVPPLLDQAMKLVPWIVVIGMIGAIPVSVVAARAILAQAKRVA